MKVFKISMDQRGYTSKPKGSEVGDISIRVGNNPMIVNNSNIKKVIDVISTKGYTFAPGTFEDGLRRKNHLQQMQLLPLDFDNGISYEEVKERAKRYELRSLFDYETLSSIDQNKFRVCFLNNDPITNVKGAEIILGMLHTIFPEADKSCRNVAQMYFGGKNLLHLDDSVPTINLKTLTRNMIIYLQDRYKTNYIRELRKFSKFTGVALTQNNIPDVIMVDEIPKTYKLAEESNSIKNINIDDNIDKNYKYYEKHEKYEKYEKYEDYKNHENCKNHEDYENYKNYEDNYNYEKDENIDKIIDKISPNSFIYINGFGENSSKNIIELNLLTLPIFVTITPTTQRNQRN